MHLFFENVIPALVRHYRGIFFKKDIAAVDVSARLIGNHDQESSRPTRGSRSCRGVAANSRSSTTHGAVRGPTDGARLDQGGMGRAPLAPQARQVKFKKTSDPWNVGPKVWERIGLDQKVRQEGPGSLLYTHPQSLPPHRRASKWLNCLPANWLP
jgi:hypothetical protein